MTSPASEATSKDFVISRVLNAPRDLVWKCFTDPERMMQWWGPKGFKLRVSKMDLRVGGTYLYAMESPDGKVMWGRMVYREITPPERMVFINSFSDEAGGLACEALSAGGAGAAGVPGKNVLARFTAAGSIVSHSLSKSLAFGSGQARR